MMNEWTRDDLPDHDVIRDVDDMHGNGMRSVVIDLALDTVVGHLNANHQKPGPDRWRRAHSIVEQERDQARESLRRLRDETDFDLFTVRDQLKQCRGEREQMTRDRDEWKARAEAAEARTTPEVTKADIEKAIRGKVWAANREPNKAGFHRVHVDWATDAVWSLVSGADPAVFVVREGDLPEVSRTYDGWTDGTRHGWEGTSETAMECVETHLEWARFYLAARRAIEAEPADPVEQKAVAAFKQAWHEADKEGDAGNRTVRGIRAARHVLGQEDRHVDQ